MMNSPLKDQDFIMEDVSFMVDWKNKFIDADECIKSFHVYISTYPGGNTFFRSSLFLKIKHISIFKNEKPNIVIFLFSFTVNNVFLACLSC